MSLVNFNGKILPADSNIISVYNRSFRYGDGLFESMRCNESGINFIDQHAKRLLQGLGTLKMSIPKKFTAEYISDQVSKLYVKQEITGDARVRLMAYRNEGGLYSPSTHDFSYLIEIEQLDESGYPLNKDGLSIGIYEEMKKPVNILSNYKTANALLFVMAGIFKNENKLDECLIKNEKGDIIEAISCNMFIVKNGVLVTPALNSGCVAGVMRETIIGLAGKNDIKVEERRLGLVEVESADEVFLTNASAGIKWVGQLGQHKFGNKMSSMLSVELQQVVGVVS